MRQNKLTIFSRFPELCLDCVKNNGPILKKVILPYNFITLNLVYYNIHLQANYMLIPLVLY